MFQRLTLDTLAAYTRTSRMEWLRWRLLQVAVPWSRKVYSQPRQRVVRTRRGFLLQIDQADWLGRHVYVTGEYEPETSDVMEALLRPGDTMVDIGANIGYFTLLAAQRVGASGSVHAFEPVNATRESLLANISLNHFKDRIQVHSEAVSNHSGELNFFVGPPDHRGTSSLRQLEHASETVTVPTAPLSELLPPDTSVQLVKIDVEGAEYSVLEGMRPLLESQHPHLILEMTDEYLRGMGHSAAMIRDELHNLGYHMYAIQANGLIPLRPEDPEPAAQYNALFSTDDSLAGTSYRQAKRVSPREAAPA